MRGGHALVQRDGSPSSFERLGASPDGLKGRAEIVERFGEQGFPRLVVAGSGLVDAHGLLDGLQALLVASDVPEAQAQVAQRHRKRDPVGYLTVTETRLAAAVNDRENSPGAIVRIPHPRLGG
jgi:hypothetical protein